MQTMGLKIRLLLAVISLTLILQAQEKQVIVRIQQQNTVLLDNFDTQIKLKRDGFKILVSLQKTDGLYVFAAFHDSLYKLAETDPIPGFEQLPAMSMAEESFNKDKEILVSDEGWSYWFYKKDLDWHRFNKKIILLDSHKVVATKTIKNVYLVADKKTRKLKDNTRTLYLFFVAVKEEDAAGKPLKELMRRKVKIEWTDED